MITFNYLKITKATSIVGSYTDYKFSQADNTAQATFTGVNFGTAASNRYILIAVGLSNNTRTVTSATIGGITATKLVELQDGISTSALLIAAVPTGTTGTIVINASGASETYMCGVWSLTGISSATPYDVDSVAGTENTEAQISLDTVSNGFAVMFGCSASGGSTPITQPTYTNLTGRFNATSAGQTTRNSGGGDDVTDGSLTTYGINLVDTGANINTPFVAASFN